MAEEDKEISGKSGSHTNPKEKGLSCEVCGENPSKYKCPGCSVRSCSLHCVKAHKQASGCNGKRQLTKFVPLSKFDDNLLISDYNMFEDVKRVADNAHRQRLKTCTYSHFRLPFPLKNLQRAAASQRTKILFLSTGMSKRQTNQSFYNNRKKTISWTIEWRFYSTDVVLLDHGVDENRSICSVIENHLKPGPWNHQLKRFCDEPVESLKFFIRKYPKGPKSPFVDLDIVAPIREQLANLVIVEYPVIHVFLPSHRYDFEVVKAASCHKLSEPVNHRENSPKGVYFREEEIEEDNTSNPQVMDLMKHLQSDEVSGSPPQPKKNETKTNDMLGNPLASSIKSSERVYENMDLDIDQGIIDSYADLISEVNPDVFFDFDGLDFDGVFEDLGIEKRDDQTIVEGFTAVEELEEGEISA